MDERQIFIVDDDPDVLSVVADLLSAHGLEPEVFQTGEQLLKRVSAVDVGCVVTDLEMPGMNGIDLQSKLIEAGSCLSVIVITAHADVPRAIQIMAQGAVTLIEKPFKSAQLVAAVERALDVSRHTFQRKRRVAEATERIQQLSRDELAIMKLAACGIPNKAISLELGISARTIDRRRQSALRKLAVASVADFAVLQATANEELR